MALAKLTIYPEPDPQDPRADTAIAVMFNPTTYSISKTVGWRPTGSRTPRGGGRDARANAPTASFGGGDARQLSLELFYDVTDSTSAQPDVREQTDRIVQLTRIRRDPQKQRPPVCRIEWGGKSADFPFTGTVTSLHQQFLLFHESGRPLRATLQVTFSEFLALGDDPRTTQLEPSARVLRQRETLAGIAAEAYGDPAAWRTIARANGIENPFELAAGIRLALPKPDATR